MSATQTLTAPVFDLSQLGAEVERLTALEAEKTAEVGNAHLAGAAEAEIARLDAERDATRKRREGLEAARDALHSREAAATVKGAADALEAQAREAWAAYQQFAAEGDAALGVLIQAIEQVRLVSAGVEALPLAGQVPTQSRVNLRDRIVATIGFAFRGVLAIPAPPVMPEPPFRRFAADAHADLIRAGWPMPTTTNETETPDHA